MTGATKGIPLIERFWRQVSPEPNSGCWLFDGHSHVHGYGIIRDNSGKQRGAHRVSLQLHGIEIPEGMHVDHLCKVTCCVNPQHLEIVTQKENNRRGPVKALARYKSSVRFCPRGHEYTEENTYTHRGCRQCIKCRRILALESYHRRKANAGK